MVASVKVSQENMDIYHMEAETNARLGALKT